MQDRAAEAKAVSDYKNWILEIAKRYLGRGYELEDLVQQGTMGFIKAYRKWTPEGGAPLGAFSKMYIQCEIRGMIGIQDGALKTARNDEPLDAAHVNCESIDTDPQSALEMRAFEATGGHTPESIAIAAERSAALRGAIGQLPETHRRIMLLALEPDELTDELIGVKLGKSRPRVQQLRTSAVEDLRVKLTGVSLAS